MKSYIYDVLLETRRALAYLDLAFLTENLDALRDALEEAGHLEYVEVTSL